MHPPQVSLLRFTNKLVLPLTLFLLTLFILASPQYACALTQEGGVYQIATSADLIEFNERINGIKGEPIPLSADALLTADIDLADANGKLMDWTPISGDYDTPYTGTFDGAGHSVKGYEITKTVGDGHAGFFCYIGEKDGKKGVVRGLTVEGGVNITSATGTTVNAGAVAGLNDGTIEDCRSAAAVIVSTDLYFNHAGGIAGQNTLSGTITSCLNDGPVAAKGDGQSSSNYAGGIVGINGGTIYNCASRATAPTSASDGEQNFAGGIAAQSSGKVYNCANLGGVSISAIETNDNQPNYAGGIVGNTSGSSGGGTPEIGSCANRGRVTLAVSGEVQLDAFRGGVLGKDTGGNATIENCAWLEGTAEHGVGSGTGTDNTKKLDENAMKNAVTTLTAQTDKRRIPVNGGSTTIPLITLPGTPADSQNVRRLRASTSSDIITVGTIGDSQVKVTAKDKTGDAAVALSADLYASDFEHPKNIILPPPPLTCSFTRAIEVVEPIHVTGVEMTSSKDVTLKGFGDTAQLSAHVIPDEATNTKIVWSSSAPGIAEVDENGKVTSKSPGTATIWAAASENQSISDDCRVTVSEEKTLSILLNIEDSKDGKKSLYAGEQFTASALFLPANATNRKLDWLIGDSSVISLDRVEEIEKGEAATFTALKAGETTTVNVKTEDGSVEGRPTLEITVLKPAVWVTGIELSKGAAQLETGEHEKLTATLFPADASDKRVEWKSSDENVASVGENGEVVAHNPGQAVVTAKAIGAEEGTTVAAGCFVTVTASPIRVQSVKISLEPGDKAVKIKPDKTYQLTATVLPRDATNKGVSWKSSDEKIATVDADGKVTTVSIGNATITVTTDDGGKEASTSVMVSPDPVLGDMIGTVVHNGCSAGVGAMALFALIPLLLKKRRPAK